MGNKIFISHLKNPDSDSLPYGKYFIDNERNKLYVSPIEQEKWEALEKSYARYNILIPIVVAVAVVFGGRIGMAIAQNSRLENILLLLACVVVLLAFFIYIKRKHSERVNQLVEETGYHLVECEAKEEADYLEDIVKHWKTLRIICISSFVLMWIFGYIIIVTLPIIPADFAVVPILIFLVPATVFAVISLVLRSSPGAISAIKKRLTILRRHG